MNLKAIALALTCSAVFASTALAQKGDDRPVPYMDHVFVIMMENHQYTQIIGNPNAPFITAYAKAQNSATNYYAVGHPSLTNYLEIVGGSNFGVVNDNAPDWHNTTCLSSLELNTPSLEGSPNTCPIAGSGLDAATPAVDTTNEGTPSEPIYNDPLAPAQTVGKTIADQLVERGMTWKSYQEDLPPYGADGVNNSDGLISNLTTSEPGQPQLYAVKHNPFAYFANVQAGRDPESSLKNVVSFYTLYKDLHTGDVPNFAFIAPDQCHDGHGRGSTEMGTGCSVDQNEIAAGDAALSTIISAIKASDFWKHGHNAIVTVWDENDYSSLSNRVVMVVDANFGPKQVTSNTKYNHFSLLKTIEAGFGLPYLNHAADKNVKLMTDLFVK